jgi:hypothetical protein
LKGWHFDATHCPALRVLLPHEWPQLPQLAAALDVFTHAFPHSVSVPEHKHFPPLHVDVPGQGELQFPQLALSVSGLVHVPLHSTSPVAQAHAEP